MCQIIRKEEQWKEGKLTGWNDVIETRNGLLTDAVVSRTEKSSKIQIGAGQVSGNTATAFGRPSAGR